MKVEEKEVESRQKNKGDKRRARRDKEDTERTRISFCSGYIEERRRQKIVVERGGEIYY